MQENGVSPDEVLFIGDTVHDKEVADSIGCECILVAKGHQSKEVLSLSGAVIADTLSDIQKAVII